MSTFNGIRSTDAGIAIDLKVVPGASRERISGRLGDRIKVTVGAPPEGGRANTAVLRILARALDRPIRSLELVAGAHAVEKTVLVRGISIESACEQLL